ncbi:hypothetical protein J437_LFUL016641, partial [Ladona fulva]
MWNETNQPAKSKHGETQKEYRKALYRQIFGNFTSRKRAGCKRNAIPNKLLLNLIDSPELLSHININVPQRLDQRKRTIWNIDLGERE